MRAELNTTQCSVILCDIKKAEVLAKPHFRGYMVEEGLQPLPEGLGLRIVGSNSSLTIHVRHVLQGRLICWNQPRKKNLKFGSKTLSALF